VAHTAAKSVHDEAGATCGLVLPGTASAHSSEAMKSIQPLHLTAAQSGGRWRAKSLAAFVERKGVRVRVNYAIVFVSDMKRSMLFYRDVLGLPLKFESPGWTEFATEGATLALHKSDTANPSNDDPQLEHAGRCRPGLGVLDLDAFHKRMIEKLVPCVQVPTETFGARIAQYVDPDGLVISVREDRRGR
jgi:lactoylglutathione lyase